MKMLRRLVLVALLAGTLLFVFGESLWRPIYVKLVGGKTVAEVVGALREQRGFTFRAADWDRLVLVGLKEERSLEVWGVKGSEAPRKLRTYPFAGFSGKLGPKLREGDGQIPEGVYRIEYLNPNSSYHLSLKVDYPNAFDRRQAKADGRDRLGGDIFIHGRSVTIGCIPIGDPAIEELFFMVAELGKENVDVIISPYDMRVRNKDVAIEGIDWEAELYARIRQAFAEQRLIGR